MTAVWETDIGPATTRLVLLALADSANDEGVCWPKMATLARKALCGLSTAREACASLEADGLLEREMRPRVGARNDTSVYRLNVAAITDPTRLASRQDPAAPPAEIRRHLPPESGDTPAEIRRGNRNKNRKKEPKEAFADADAPEDASGDQLALVPAAVVEQDGKDATDLFSRAMRAYLANWDREKFGAAMHVDMTERWVRSIVDRFDCDPVALLAAVEAAALRGKVNPAPAYVPAPLTGSRLTKAAQAVAKAVYDAQHGEVAYVSLMQRAKTAMKAGREPGDVHDAMIRLIKDNKPITQQLLAHYAEQVRLDRQASSPGVVQG